MRDPYEIFGLSKDALKEEFEAKYSALKSQYSEGMFLEGEAGNTAARNLSELEGAWNLVKSDLEKRDRAETFGGDMGAIDNLIKEQRFDEAQAALDSITNRTAQWHYLQSIIYYKREWLSESKAQLEIAVSMEPWNTKFKQSLDKLIIVMGNPKVDPNTIGNAGGGGGQPAPDDGAVCGNACSNCCLAYCLTDCCCTMARCCG